MSKVIGTWNLVRYATVCLKQLVNIYVKIDVCVSVCVCVRVSVCARTPRTEASDSFGTQVTGRRE